MIELGIYGIRPTTDDVLSGLIARKHARVRAVDPDSGADYKLDFYADFRGADYAPNLAQWVAILEGDKLVRARPIGKEELRPGTIYTFHYDIAIILQA